MIIWSSENVTLLRCMWRNVRRVREILYEKRTKANLLGGLVLYGNLIGLFLSKILISKGLNSFDLTFSPLRC